MKVRDLSEILQPYKSGWVIINEATNRVVAHTNTFSDIVEKAKRLKDKNHTYITSAYPRTLGFIG